MIAEKGMVRVCQLSLTDILAIIKETVEANFAKCDYGTEWNFAHHLASALAGRQEFRGYDVDVEPVKETGERPDIIIHRRGPEGPNYVAIEIKKGNSKDKIEKDIEKLKETFERKYKYGYRVSLVVGMRRGDEENIKQYADKHGVGLVYSLSDSRNVFDIYPANG